MKWARDYLAMARAAALQLAAIDADLSRKFDALQLSAQKYAESRSGDVDPQAAIDAYIDAEMAAEAARMPLLCIVDDATELLYGPHARAGVAKLLGAKYADVLCWRWLQLRSWREIARDLRCSVRWAQQLEQDALDWMDKTGESHIRAHNGIESDYYESMRWGGDE